MRGNLGELLLSVRSLIALFLRKAGTDDDRRPDALVTTGFKCSGYKLGWDGDNGKIDTRRQSIDRLETGQVVDFPVRSTDRVDPARIRVLADGLDQPAPDNLLVRRGADQGN